MQRLGNILLICFFLSYLLIVISSAVFYGAYDKVIVLLERVCRMSAQDINIGMFYFYAVVKTITIFFFLVPAVAIKLTEPKK